MQVLGEHQGRWRYQKVHGLESGTCLLSLRSTVISVAGVKWGRIHKAASFGLVSFFKESVLLGMRWETAILGV